MRWDNGCPQCFGTGVDHGELCDVCGGRPSRAQRRRIIETGLDELVREGTLDPHVDVDSGEVFYIPTEAGLRALDEGRDPVACSVTASDQEVDSCS